MLSSQLLALLLGAVAAFARANPSSTPLVDLGYATYQGSVDPATNITSFLGIRFAAAPTGDARFRAPQSPHTVPGVQNATTQPPQCYQILVNGVLDTNPFRDNASSTSSSASHAGRSQAVLAKRAPSNVSDEDCLFLSVYMSPNATSTSNLPVLVWIHGGGYLEGSSSQFRGSDLIKESPDSGLIVVVIQYRLGLFGFLAGSEVHANGSLNAGLLDQQFALQWVQKHISKFGGNPAHVTIWGESAGGGSILQQVIANGGKTNPPLFKAAIASSPFVPAQDVYNSRIPQSRYDSVVALSGCSSASDSLACLRTVDASVLEDANIDLALNSFFGTYAFGPVVEDSNGLIQQSPTRALREGKVNGDALLTVTNAFEGRIFVNTSIGPVADNVSDYALNLYPNLPANTASKIEEIYADVGSTSDQIVALYGDTVFMCTAYLLLASFPSSTPTYKAEFAIPPGNHGTDLQYYFPSLVEDVPVLNYPTFFNNTIFIEAFARSFTAFATSAGGDPAAKGTITPMWRQWKDGNRSGDGVSIVRMGRSSSLGYTRSRRMRVSWSDVGQFWDEMALYTGH
ncbi:Carboxylic ester hydrolase [Mycena chlorophos]|uniref:Carboxylic ester hydrolase n=1 Tax=Mycena chlorophos TaxID=658473 RepID=A0A8H6TIE7_MYCCL|nr:Carboxylic ester hydrolase [Mycena chlorophos]